jgi:hypothetical protein
LVVRRHVPEGDLLQVRELLAHPHLRHTDAADFEEAVHPEALEDLLLHSTAAVDVAAAVVDLQAVVQDPHVQRDQRRLAEEVALQLQRCSGHNEAAAHHAYQHIHWDLSQQHSER